MSVFRQETATQLKALSDAIDWVLKEKFGINGIQEIENADEATLRKIEFQLPQILEEFRRPEVLVSIIGDE